MTPTVAVITPYFKESEEVLLTCRDSVLAQTFPCTLFAVSDGFPSAVFDQPSHDIQHIRLPRPNADNGNTPRGVGTMVALAENYDFIAYLDADNWYDTTHIDTLIDLQAQTQAAVVCSKRTFHRLDGSRLDITEEAEDLHKHVDTSCYLIHRSCFSSLLIWSLIPKQLSPVCDRVFFQKLINDRCSMAFSDRRTVAFRSQYSAHYLQANEPAPPGAKEGRDVFGEMLKFLLTEQGASETVKALGFYPPPSLILV